MNTKRNRRIEIFTTDSVNPKHHCYCDPENMLKIYLDSIFCEVEEYLEYELRQDKDVFLFIASKLSNFGVIHGRSPEINFEVAGFNELATTDRSEAVEFMIDKIVEEIDQGEQTHDNIPAIKNSLREVLSRQ